MNKKGSFIETLTKILLILIVLVLLILGGGRLLWDAGKSALSVFGLINITEVDYSQLNKDAQSSFETFIKDIKACKNSKDNNCLCYTSLSGFSNVYTLEINNNEIKLINVKDNNKITMNKQDIKDFNCYYTKELVVENPVLINFDEDLPRIDKNLVGIGFLARDIRFHKNPAIYKSSKICLVSTSFDLTKVIKICKV
ncbi:MAG: hypothetical protein AABY32_00245 [Nanoarchaeota archaeon]